MSDVTIYHNSRCSKSRQALELLQERGLDIDVVEYLKNPPDKKALRALHKKLGVNAHDMLRSNETEYTESGLGDSSSDEEVYAAIARFPKLLERPIVVRGSKAVIARPLEKLENLF